MVITEVRGDNGPQLQDIANIIAAAKRVVMVTGAGISTNCGIPDFRSEGGLYATAKSTYSNSTKSTRSTIVPKPSVALSKGRASGKNLFDSMIWRDQNSTAAFYQTIASLRSSIQEDVRRSSHAHRLIRTLRDQRKLIRCYTQNIDGLEERVGLSTNLERGKGTRSRFGRKAMQTIPSNIGQGVLDRGCEVVQLHGDLKDLRCTLCQQCIRWDSGVHTPRFLSGQPPECPTCTTNSEHREWSGKRGTKIGTLRPNVVLYGEEHPSADVVGEITAHDLSLQPDLLLVMGTSLHVHGLKTIVREFAKAVHSRPKNSGKVIFVNLSKPAESTWRDVFDFWVAMDCDQWVDATRSCRPDIWQVQSQLAGKVTKSSPLILNSAKRKREIVEEDKENVIPDSEDSDASPLSPPPPKVVIMTPKKQANPRKLSSPRANSSAKKLFTASRVIPDSDPASSLPTPPSSGPAAPSSHRKRKRKTEEAGENFCVTPSKRSRFTGGQQDMRKVAGSQRSDPVIFSPPSKRGKAVQVWEDA